jgi:hypothetical protein
VLRPFRDSIFFPIDSSAAFGDHVNQKIDYAALMPSQSVFEREADEYKLLTANRRSARPALARQMIGEAFTIRALSIKESVLDL